MTRVPVAVVGVGHLGKEHARILSGLEGVELVGVADPNAAQAEAVAQRCGTRAFADHRALLGQVRAAVVAAPTFAHHAVALDLLPAGVALLIEKPLALNAEQATEMEELAAKHGVVLQVGHIERFNPAFEELQSRTLRACYLQAERCGGFTGRSTDVGVVLDLMIHDIDLVLTLVKAPVARVEAFGVAVVTPHEDVAQARLTFANGCIADLTASRAHPEPLRRMRVWGAEGYAGVDFAKRQITLTQPSDTLRWMTRSARPNPAQLATLKTGLFGDHLQSLELDCNGRYQADQLTRELEEFVRCVRTQATPRVDGAAGRDALDVASQILESIRSHAWEGSTLGPVGPRCLPTPGGPLFIPAKREAA